MTVTTGTSSGNSTWNWRVAARCRTTDGDELFVSGAAQREARGFCFACPVRTECLAHALDERIEFGVWGGATERERRAMLRARPGVRSWAALLGEARLAHYTAETTSIRAAAAAASTAGVGTADADAADARPGRGHAVDGRAGRTRASGSRVGGSRVTRSRTTCARTADTQATAAEPVASTCPPRKPTRTA